MIIDAHMHLVRRANYDLATFNRMKLGVPNDTPIEDVISHMKGAGVTKMVAMGQDMSRIWNTEVGGEWPFECAEKYPDFIIPYTTIEAVDKGGRFNKEGYEKFKRDIFERKVKGALITPPYGQYRANDRRVYPFYELAWENNIVMQYHHSAMGGPAVLVNSKYFQFDDLNDVIVDFPEIKINIEHLGYPYAEPLFCQMCNNKNMYGDLAMMYNKPIWVAWQLVKAREYGVLDRIMYATDYVSANFDIMSDKPAEDLKRYIHYIKFGINEINEKMGWPLLTQDEIDGILYKNCCRMLEIPEED